MVILKQEKKHLQFIGQVLIMEKIGKIILALNVKPFIVIVIKEREDYIMS